MLAPPNSGISVALCIRPRKLLFRYVRRPQSLGSRRVPLAESKHKRRLLNTGWEYGTSGDG